MTAVEVTTATVPARVWVLPASAEEPARDRVERVNKRLRRNGLTPYVLTVEHADPWPEFEKRNANGSTVIDGIDWPTVDGVPCPVMWHEQIKVTVTGEPPRFADWEFVASIEFDPNAGTLTRPVPGVEVNLDALRARDASECDHCREPRNRHKVYAVRHMKTGELKQVGSTCLTAFLGVQVSLAHVDIVFADTIGNDLDSFGGGGWADSDRSASPDDVLAIAVWLIARHGWISKSAGHGTPTSSKIMDVLSPGSDWQRRQDALEVWKAISADDRETAGRILTYARTIDGNSEWAKNLCAVASGKRVSLHNVALLASAVPSYNKHIERLYMERVRLESAYQGVLKEKWRFTGLTVVRVDPRENAFSPWGALVYMVKFVDRDGNVFAWRASRFDHAPGDVVDVIATVKEHSEWKSGRETWITRAAVTGAAFGPALPHQPATPAAKPPRARKPKNTAPAGSEPVAPAPVPASVMVAAPVIEDEIDPWADVALTVIGN